MYLAFPNNRKNVFHKIKSRENWNRTCVRENKWAFLFYFVFGRSLWCHRKKKFIYIFMYVFQFGCKNYMKKLLPPKKGHKKLIIINSNNNFTYSNSILLCFSYIVLCLSGLFGYYLGNVGSFEHFLKISFLFY